MNKMESDNKFSKLRGYYAIIATATGCSRETVRSVLTGRRVPKTARAEKSQLIITKADELLKLLSSSTKTA